MLPPTIWYADSCACGLIEYKRCLCFALLPLQALILRFNEVGPEGATALAVSLKVNTVIAGIALDVNPVGDAGAEALLAALKNEAKQVTFLSVRSKTITDDTLPGAISDQATANRGRKDEL